MTVWRAFFGIYISYIKFIGCAVCFNWAIERKRAVAFQNKETYFNRRQLSYF